MKKVPKIIGIAIGGLFIIPSAVVGFTVGMVKLGYDLGYNAFK